MMTLKVFEKRLETLIGRPSDVRPFVCDGNPLEAKVFIVGFNPASISRVDFWHWWTQGEGFRKSDWFEGYKEERMRAPRKPGKTRRLPVSNTRRVLNWIADAAHGASILETNIYPTPSADKKGLPASHRDPKVFRFLLESVRPRIVVAHGDDAREEIRLHSIDAEIVEVRHFSRGWSELAARELGRSLSERILAAPN